MRRHKGNCFGECFIECGFWLAIGSTSPPLCQWNQTQKCRHQWVHPNLYFPSLYSYHTTFVHHIPFTCSRYTPLTFIPLFSPFHRSALLYNLNEQLWFLFSMMLCSSLCHKETNTKLKFILILEEFHWTTHRMDRVPHFTQQQYTSAFLSFSFTIFVFVNQYR